MPLDAWRDEDDFVVEFDLPGVDPCLVHLEVDRNVLTVKAERKGPDGDTEYLAAERPKGVFSMQLFLGETLDVDRISASYDAGVLSLRIPVTAQARRRKIEVSREHSQRQAIRA